MAFSWFKTLTGTARPLLGYILVDGSLLWFKTLTGTARPLPDWDWWLQVHMEQDGCGRPLLDWEWWLQVQMEKSRRRNN
ncbi:hypothetical protein V8B55DRAFT_1441107 [Mucor lusitanicus]